MDLLVLHKPPALWEANSRGVGSMRFQCRQKVTEGRRLPPSRGVCGEWAALAWTTERLPRTRHRRHTLAVYVSIWALFWDPCFCLDFREKSATQIRQEPSEKVPLRSKVVLS